MNFMTWFAECQLTNYFHQYQGEKISSWVKSLAGMNYHWLIVDPCTEMMCTENSKDNSFIEFSYEMPEAFIDREKVIKSHIPTGNAPINKNVSVKDNLS